MRLFQWLNRLRRDRRGNALVIGAATLPLVIGAAAVGVDTVQMSLARRQLQRTADSAALAGGYALVQEQDVATSANHDLNLNNDMPLSATVVENAPTAGPYANNPRAVRVALTANRTVPFISFFTGSPATITAEATAAIVYVGQFCMVSLENSNTVGITFSGSTVVNLGCGVSSNSSAASAVSASGSARVTASPVAAVGGVPSSAAYVGETMLLPFSPPQEDPFADLPTPTVPASCSNHNYKVLPNHAQPSMTASSPGVYCFTGGIDINGTWDIPAGSQIIVNGGTLNFQAQANVNCTGCTFILTSSNAVSDPSSVATISMNGNAVLNVSAPDTGTYAGVLMYQDRRAAFGSSTINGNSASFFQGGFYFPAHQLTFNGNTGMRTECMQMVARRLVFTGNSEIQNNCPANSGSQAFDATFVRLVG